MRTGPRRLVYSDPTYATRWAKRLAENRAKVRSRGDTALREIEGIGNERGTAEVTGTERDGDLQVLAERRADHLRRESAGIENLADLSSLIRSLGGRPHDAGSAHGERARFNGMHARAVCAVWWLRQLRRLAARRHEADAIDRGEVGRQHRQTYCTDFALRRRARSKAAAAAMLEATWIENEDGEELNLKACFDASVSNKAIRRGELMTRIRGCEEWADEKGHVGVFLTLTTPSRFHSVGGSNRHFDGSTPRDAQAWLCAQWAVARAALARAGVTCYGFRVAEPHRDGCPHWHALLWAESNAAAAALCIIVRRYWLQWDEAEQGAREHRFKAERILMEKGGAVAYLAKYIAKNIDDAGSVGTEGHRDDDWEGAAGTQGDLFNGTAARVDAWASTWGIRQFQAIGQPPVTVWRELRRIDRAEHEANAPMRIGFAMSGAHKVGDERASWVTFIKAQGGTCTGRDYLVRVAKLVAEHEGRYETIEVAKPIGVYEAGVPEAVVPSVRKQWVPRGSRGSTKLASEVQGAKARQRSDVRNGRRVPPWTRFNNCTQPPFRAVVADLLERLKPVIFSEPPWPQTQPPPPPLW